MNSPITPDEAAALEKMLEAATPGEWHHDGHAYLNVANGNVLVDCSKHADAEAIAALHNAAPALLATVKEYHRLTSAMETLAHVMPTVNLSVLRLGGIGESMPVTQENVFKLARELGWRDKVTVNGVPYECIGVHPNGGLHLSKLPSTPSEPAAPARPEASTRWCPCLDCATHGHPGYRDHESAEPCPTCQGAGGFEAPSEPAGPEATGIGDAALLEAERQRWEPPGNTGPKCPHCSARTGELHHRECPTAVVAAGNEILSRYEPGAGSFSDVEPAGNTGQACPNCGRENGCGCITAR